MIQNAAKYWAVLKLTWIRTLEYKANAFVGLFAIISGIAIEYLIWIQIFATQKITEIRGFTFIELMIYLYLSIIVGQLKSSWQTSQEMIDDIRNGGLNRYLVRPISYFWYNFSLFIGHNSLYYIIYGLLILIAPFIFPAYLFQNYFHIFGFLLALILSIFLSYSVYFFMVGFAFWFGEVRSLITAYNLANVILAGQMVPLSFFPAKMQYVLSFTPIPYLVDFPVSIATSRLDMSLWPMGFLKLSVWIVVIYIAGQIVYRIGIRKYGAFGA
jgi:ABC-2 type transport system permease protein